MTRNLKKLENIPYKTYFPNAMLENLFKTKSGIEDFNSVSIGSPWFDHSLFVDTADRDHKVVLLLCPDYRSLKPDFVINELQDFSDYCSEKNIRFI